MIKALIFDLDNCLADAHEVGDVLYEPAFEAMRKANDGTVSDTALHQALDEMWQVPLDRVAARYGFTEKMLQAGWQVFAKLEAACAMKGYGDLEHLLQLPIRRFLVTTGFRRLQESKVGALGLGSHFDGIYIDAIDEPNRVGKQGFFERILQENHFTPEEVLVIGDSAHSEIEAGNNLGIRTVQTLRSGVPRTETATYHIQSLEELPELLRQLEREQPESVGAGSATNS